MTGTDHARSEPDNIVFYWAGGVVPPIVELSVLSALGRSVASRVTFFLDDDHEQAANGKPVPIPEWLSALEICGRLEIRRLSLNALVEELGFRPYKSYSLVTRLRHVLGARLAENLKSRPALARKLARSKLGRLFVGYHHPHFGLKLVASLGKSILAEGKPYRADVFRILAAQLFEGESYLYSDCDVYFSRPFPEWPLGTAFSYKGGDLWANTALLFFPKSRSDLSRSLLRRLREGVPALPWFFFDGEFCSDAGIVIHPADRFDPPWTLSSLSHGRTDLFFTNESFSHAFSRELDQEFLAAHWHNQWNCEPDAGSTFDLFLRRERRRFSSAHEGKQAPG